MINTRHSHPDQLPTSALMVAPRVGLGGMTRQLVESSIGLRARGVDVALLSVDRPGIRQHAEPMESAGVAVHLVEKIARSTLVPVLKESNAQFVRLFSGTFPPRIKLATKIAAEGVPVIETLHAMTMRTGSGAPGALRVADHHGGAMRRYRAAALSRPMYDECVRRLPAMKGWFVELPYGMRLPEHTSDLAKPAGGGRPLKVLSATRLVEHHKDTATLIRAIGQLVHKHRLNIDLRIAGDGPDRATLEALAAEEGVAACCEFAGWVDDPREEMRRADVFVLSTKSESFGRVNVEAAAAGTPVVASDVLGCRASVGDGVNGLLVPPGDAGALAEALVRLHEDEPLRQRLGEAGPGFAAQFSIEAHVDGLLRLAARLIRR